MVMRNMTRIPVGTTPTIDPNVFIEEQRRGYVRYVRTTDGRRWEVHGQCSLIGKCWEGIADLKSRTDWEALNLDCPVTPEFNRAGCCQFTYVELAPAGG